MKCFKSLQSENEGQRINIIFFQLCLFIYYKVFVFACLECVSVWLVNLCIKKNLVIILILSQWETIYDVSIFCAAHTLCLCLKYTNDNKHGHMVYIYTHVHTFIVKFKVYVGAICQ